MNHLLRIVNIFFVGLFFLTLASGAGAVNNDMMKITYEPAEFDIRHLIPQKGAPVISNRSRQEFILDTSLPIFPHLPRPVAKGQEIELSGVNANIPSKVKIELTSEALRDFTWRQVPIPVLIGSSFFQVPKTKGLSMSFQEKSGTGQVKTVPVSPYAWRHQLPLNSPEFDDPESLYHAETLPTFPGHSDYWNMTYFTDLPKRSITYDFWVTVRGVDSEKKAFSIEFYVDGQKVTADNFEKMKSKYPALD